MNNLKTSKSCCVCLDDALVTFSENTNANYDVTDRFGLAFRLHQLVVVSLMDFYDDHVLLKLQGNPSVNQEP